MRRTEVSITGEPDSNGMLRMVLADSYVEVSKKFADYKLTFMSYNSAEKAMREAHKELRGSVYTGGILYYEGSTAKIL